jgi:hypothetical protein
MSVKRSGALATLLFVFIVAEAISYLTVPIGGSALDGKLDKVHAKAIDLLVDLAKLFITFSYGILGAIAFFVTNSEETPIYRSSGEFGTLVGSVAAAVASIYWGHLIITSIIEMLTNGFLTLDSARIVWSVRLQYICTVVGSVLLVAYVLSRAERMAQHKHRIGK